MSVATETIDPTIVDDLTSLPDKPAAAPLGASCQWQMLQPAGQSLAPPEAQKKSVSVSNDPRIGAFRLSRSSSLTGSGGLCPADSPAEFTRTTLKSSTRGSRLQLIGRAASCHIVKATRVLRPCPSHGPDISAMALSAPDASTRSFRLTATPNALACSSLRTGGGRQPSLIINVAAPAPRNALGTPTLATLRIARNTTVHQGVNGTWQHH